MSAYMNPTSIGSVPFTRTYILRGRRKSGCAIDRPKRLETYLEEDEEIVEFAFERAAIEAGSTSVEKRAHEAHAEEVVESIDRRRNVRPRPAFICQIRASVSTAAFIAHRIGGLTVSERDERPKGIKDQA